MNASVTIPIDDYRTIHAAKILSLQNGDVIRCGIVSQSNNHGGLITDEASIQWIPEGKVKKAEPLKNGSPPGSLHIVLHNLTSPLNTMKTPNVSLILALPRPIALNRMIPMIAQMGVETLVLSGARKVPKDYFGSHLFRNPTFIRDRLIEGLCQSGDVRLPKIIIVRNLADFLQYNINDLFPVSEYARAVAHPQRDVSDTITRLKDLQYPNMSHRKMVIAVGPEGGWEEPEEINQFVHNHGFVQVSMGNRVLRSDCAVISLLALAHDACT